jgi:HNH endonuclease
VKRTRRRLRAAERRAKDLFDRAVLAKGECVLADGRIDAHGPLRDAHHIIRKQTLRAHASTMTEQDRMELLWDPRNGVPVCRKHHEQLTTAYRRLTRAQVPPEVWHFAEEHGLVHALERELARG